MDPNAQKEQFSDAFLHAIAAVSECACCKPSVDDDSIDWTLNKVIAGRPKLDIQLKCTAGAPSDTHLAFFLRRKNYEDLRLTNVLVPRILVVVMVPEEVTDWLLCGPDEMTLQHRAFWFSLRGLPEPANPTGETIYIPVTQRLTTTSLNTMMHAIATGGVV